MGALPEPLVPAGTVVRDLAGFMLSVERLLASELWALSTGDEFKAAMGLWCRAWQQDPGGSLPNEDRVLAVFSSAGPKWRKVKEMALRGFILCSDGRLYHKVLCEDVLRAAARQKQFRERRDKDAERLRNWRKNNIETPSETTSETPDETRFVAEETGRDGTVPKEDTSPSGDVDDNAHDKEPSSGRGTRLAPDWRPSQEDWEFASHLGLDPEAAADEFRDYWCAVPGGKGRKLDWSATFRNRCRELASRNRGNAGGKRGPDRQGSGGIAAALGRVSLAPRDQGFH